MAGMTPQEFMKKLRAVRLALVAQAAAAAGIATVEGQRKEISARKLQRRRSQERLARLSRRRNRASWCP